MKNKFLIIVIASLIGCSHYLLHAQELKGVYVAMEESFGQVITHELKFGNTFSTHTVYQVDSPFFIKTLGGFYEQKEDVILLVLEFNSDYAKDSITTKTLSYELDGDKLILNGNKKRIYVKQAVISQDLDGTWLFGTRGPDLGQDRRGDTRSRKTLKFMIDGRFQWIAYDVGDFRFMGTGGGNYTAEDGKYTENVEYFSRDNSRAGTSLKFMYKVHEDDWHHIGNNSRGEPMYEIWMRRNR